MITEVAGMPRDGNNFSKQVREDLAKRAGHRCSAPACGAHTVGPSSASEKLSTSNGWASHIYPASDIGPRSQHTPPDADLGQIENGIWLCERHGSLIDKNDGLDYPPQLLRKWKQNAETAARLRQTGLPPTPNLDAIVIPEQKLWDIQIEHTRIELNRHTLLAANDSLAYKHIMNALAKVESRPSQLAALLGGGDFEMVLEFSLGHLKPVRVSYAKGKLNYWIGDASVDAIIGTYFPIFIDENVLRRAFDEESFKHDGEIQSSWSKTQQHTPFIHSALSDAFIAEKMARSLRNQDTILVRDLRLGQNGEWEANCLGHTPTSYFQLSSLSGGERLSVVLDLTFAAARLRREAVVVIVVDDVIWQFDRENLKRFKRVCERLPSNVQVVVSTTNQAVTSTLADWQTEVLHFHPNAPRSISHSSPPMT